MKGGIEMFEFLKSNKTINAVSMLDLRNYTPESLKKIKKINAAGIIILPENPSPEFMESFSNITIKASGSIISLPMDRKLVNYGGIQEIKNLKTEKNTCAYLHGIIVLSSTENKPDCMFGGIVIKNKDADVNLIGGASGLVFETEFDANKVKIFTNTVVIDTDFIRNIEKDTFIVCGNCLEIAKDVDEEQIVEKNLKFFAGNTVECNKKILGCVRARAMVGNEITEKI